MADSEIICTFKAPFTYFFSMLLCIIWTLNSDDVKRVHYILLIPLIKNYVSF